mmetsp:Transcript_5843/g.16362  ORF Transcript_5843/g.16362 Transcript_5843/m.16362 type:complete len:335 (-) Transcript_5843:233-1237(-)
MPHDAPAEILQVARLRVCRRVHAKQARVVVVCVERHHRVGEVIRRNELAKLRPSVPSRARVLIPGSKHRLHHHEGDGVWVCPRRALKRDGQVHERLIRVPHAHLASREERWLVLHEVRRTDALLRELGEVLLRRLDQRGVIDAPRRGNHHAVSRVVRRNIVHQVLLGDRPHIIRRPENGAPERTVLERSRVQVIKHNLLRHALNLLHLAQDDVPLALNRVLLQLGVLKNIGQYVHRLADMPVLHLCKITRLLAGRVRIQMPPDILNLDLKILHRSLLRAFERHMLQKVRRSIGRVRLVPRTRINPDAHRRRRRPRHLLAHHAHAVRETCDLGLR